MLVWSDNQVPKDSEGYGYVPYSIFPFLENSGLPIRRSFPRGWEQIGQLQLPQEIATLNGMGIGYMEKDECSNEIIINHSTPSAFIKSNIYSIGFTYWETNRLPNDWVTACNKMDEIWTCSLEMQKIFIASGIERPVYEFKLGVNPDIFYPKLRTPHSPFTFLSMGSPSSRKNSQMTVDAFLKLYDGNHDYRLLYKTNGEPDGRIYRGGTMYPLRHPQIEVIDDNVSHERLGEIYDMADCLVYPTSGEGWGMIPFQAIAKGIPTICTDALASTEYAYMSVPLDFKWDKWKMNGIYSDAGEWAVPDFDDLCDKMQYIATNYEEVANKTYQSALHINKNMTWGQVSKSYIDRMKDILKERA